MMEDCMIVALKHARCLAEQLHRCNRRYIVHIALKELGIPSGQDGFLLAKKSGLSQSTIANIYRRNTVPSIATLEVICKGFGITLSQFFADEQMVELTPDLKRIFDCWVNLTPSQKDAAVQMLMAMNAEDA